MLYGTLSTHPPSTISTMLFNLSHLALLKLQGKETENFLQGQLTSDIRLVTDTHYQPAALCNLQGKIISLIKVCRWNNDFFLILPRALLEIVTRTLAKPAQFSRIQIIEENNLSVTGYFSPADQQSAFQRPENSYSCLSTDTYFIGCIEKPFYFLILPQELADQVPRQTDCFDWHKARLMRADIEIYANTTEQFLPHRLNLQETPCISFNKGCYRGQEIIARTHYRGTLKYSLGQYQVRSEAPLEPGMKIYDSAAQPLGDLVDVCRLPEDNNYLIAASLRLNHPMTVGFVSHENTCVLQPIQH
jgi:tRNA-modifying protein YgfZ